MRSGGQQNDPDALDNDRLLSKAFGQKLIFLHLLSSHMPICFLEYRFWVATIQEADGLPFGWAAILSVSLIKPVKEVIVCVSDQQQSITAPRHARNAAPRSGRTTASAPPAAQQPPVLRQLPVRLACPQLLALPAPLRFLVPPVPPQCPVPLAPRKRPAPQV